MQVAGSLDCARVIEFKSISFDGASMLSYPTLNGNREMFRLGKQHPSVKLLGSISIEAMLVSFTPVDASTSHVRFVQFAKKSRDTIIE